MKKEEGTVRKKEVKAILFDLDGVLVDSLDAWHAVFTDILKELGKPPILKKEFKGYFGMPLSKDIELFFQGKTPKWINAQKDRFFRKNKHLVRIFPHTSTILKETRKKRLKTAIISNSTRSIVGSVLKDKGLRGYFDAILTAEDVGKGKPNPEMVKKACRLLGVRPSQAIVVGDTQNDMKAGKRAGCTTIGYKTKGDFCVKSLRMVMEIVK